MFLSIVEKSMGSSMRNVYWLNFETSLSSQFMHGLSRDSKISKRKESGHFYIDFESFPIEIKLPELQKFSSCVILPRCVMSFR
jgi:hypothetical protein